MANTLTDLIPDAYAALDVVSRELVGMIPAVTMDATVDRAAVGQKVRSFVAPAAAASNITPGVTAPDNGNQTIGNVEIEITKARGVPFRWNGEQSRGVNNGGPGRNNIIVNQIAQAMRTLTNEIEADLAALHPFASRAVGAAGTTPFSTAGNFEDASNALKILKDNGAPTGDAHLILNTAAGAKLLGLQSRVDMQGADSMLRQGVILDHAGLSIRESAQINTFTKGTATSATTNNAGYAVGATVITLASAGTGTILAGDVIKFADDDNLYVVASGDADVSNGGTITLAAPGLRQAIPTSTKAITVQGNSARNMVFSRNAILLAQRAPALPDEGDMADDRTTIVDPRSGLSFELSMYKQYRQVRWEVASAWGVQVIKTEHFGLLLG